MDKKWILLFVLVTACLMFGCAQHSSKSKTKETDIDTSTYITSAELVNENHTAKVYTLRDSEKEDNMVSGYLDGLLVDVYLVNKTDASLNEKTLVKEYAGYYMDNLNSIGYEIKKETILIDDKECYFKDIQYKGTVDGETRSGHYLFLSAQNDDGSSVIYCINQPLSGLGEEGEEALKSLMVVLEKQYK